MKERGKGGDGAIEQKMNDNATMNFVTFQAQEAILNPNLPESYKDAVVGAAVGTIRKIAERRSAYDVLQSVKQELKNSPSASQTGMKKV